jgi:PAS domain S-box-containing protein
LVHHTMGYLSERGEQGPVADAIPHEYRDQHAVPLTWQLAETGELLAEVLAQLTESVATLTETGIVVSWNAPASQLTGYTLAEINRTGFWHLFEPPQTMQELTQQARQGTRVDERLVLRRANGQHISVGVRCFPLRHLGDTEGRVVVVMRDLSELEALQDQLLQSERLSMLGRLAGAMSHELRNPLTAIFLQAEILEDELQQLHADNQTQILRSLQVIKDEIARLHELVQQYLSLTRLSDLQREPVDFSKYLERFCTEMREQLAVRHITLRFEPQNALGQVAVHQNSFRRALLNLVNNAVEAMPQGGTVTLRGQRLAESVRLEVSDTGSGIPPEQVPLLFSPLHTTKPEGTGLGLYLVREIVTAHAGKIAVTSASGQGTTFTITLPLHTPESALRT